MTEAECTRCGDTFNPHGNPEDQGADHDGDRVGTTLDGRGIFRHWARTNDGPEQGEPCDGLGIETWRSVRWRAGAEDLAERVAAIPTATFEIPGTFLAELQPKPDPARRPSPASPSHRGRATPGTSAGPRTRGATPTTPP